jgi:hypothetical protein
MSIVANDHWLEHHYDLMQKCENLRHLADVGIGMALNLRATAPDGKVYLISGPMTTGGVGPFHANMHVFGHCITVAREHGLTVFNQLPFQEGMIRILKLDKDPTYKRDDASYPQSILDDFYWPLFKSGALTHLLVMPTWETSNGATQERNKALTIPTFTVEEMDQELYEEALKRSAPYLQSVL